MHVRDRLHHLRQASIASGTSAASNASTASEHEHEPSAADASYAEDIQDILEEAERLLQRTQRLADNTLLLQRLHADPTFHANKTLQDQLDAVVSESNTLAAEISATLVQLETKTRGVGGVGCVGGASGAGGARNDARARIARLQYLSARRRYADALSAHRRLLAAVRDQQARLLHDQLKLTKLAITEDECEALLDNNNISLFVDNVRAETAEARLALRAVEARRDELARLETALREVRDLFARLALLVADQQEQIDSVQHFALQATDYVESGEQQLLQGVVKRAKGNKKKVQIIICMVVGFAVVLLVLIVT